MKSIREIFRIGYGPSSSHTMGPGRAAYYFKEKNPDAERYRVTLYGSLALTGVGHGTDVAIQKMINRPDDTNYMGVHEILPHHPNGMLFEALRNGEVVIVGRYIVWEVAPCGMNWEPSRRKMSIPTRK
ncbi:MAG: serine dehydratase beta chain [Butyricimonas faecihominis]